MTDETYESELAKALRARERKVYQFDVRGFFHLGDRPIPRLGVRRPTKAEQDEALVGAHEYAAEKAGRVEGAKSDAEILQDAKAAFIACTFCRELVQKDGEWVPTKYPAFPGPRWMCENLPPEEIAVLLNLGNEVRAKEAPAPLDIDDEAVERWIAVCQEAAGTPVPEAVLAGCPREYVTHLFVLASLKLKAAREEQAPAAPPARLVAIVDAARRVRAVEPGFSYDEHQDFRESAEWRALVSLLDEGVEPAESTT